MKGVGLWDEVDFYIKRLGWEEWVMQKFPSYEVIIYEFLSLFEFNSSTNKMKFRLGNEDFEMSIWEIKRALNMPIMFSQFPSYNKSAFWKQLTDLDEGFNPRTSKASKIISHSLRYMHRLLAHTVLGRKESDGQVNSVELDILYAMVYGHKMELSHVIALRLSDIAKASRGTIRMGFVVLALAQYKGFDIASITYPKCKGDMRIGYAMMVNMGLIMRQGDGYALVPHPRAAGYQPPRAEDMGDASHQPVTLEHVMTRMHAFDVRMTSLEGSVREINHHVNHLQHDLRAYLEFQGFQPPPFPTPPPTPVDDCRALCVYSAEDHEDPDDTL